MTPQKSVRFDIEYHGDVYDVQIGNVDGRNNVGRLGKNSESILIMPSHMNCIYSCRCNDSRGDRDRDNFCEGKEHRSMLRISKEGKSDLMRNNCPMRSAELYKVDNRRCKKVISEKGFPSIDDDTSERVRFCEVCLHAGTIAECRTPGKCKGPEEYLHGGLLTRKGMKVPTHESNCLANQQRRSCSSNSCPGGSAILKYLKKGKKKKKKKKKRKRKEKSKGNISLPFGGASKMATLLHKKSVHLGHDKNLNNDNGVVVSTREEKNENVMGLSKGKPVNSLEGAIRTRSYGKENAPRMKPLRSCRGRRNVFRSHLKLHRLKCRSMKIIEKLKDAMIKENIAYNKRVMTLNGGHENGRSLSIKGKERDPDNKGVNNNGDCDNNRSHGNGDRAERGIVAKRTKGTWLKEEDYLVYKFRRILRRYVKKYLHKKIINLKNFRQAKRNIANEKKVHTFIIPSMSDRNHKKVSNYCSYVEKYVRKFFHSYFVTLVNNFFNNFFFHYKRKCMKNYVGNFGTRGEKLDGETATHHQPFYHSRFVTKDDNVACSRVMCSSCLDTSMENCAPCSGREDTTSKEVQNMLEGRNSLRVFSLPNVNRNLNEGHGNAEKDPYSSYRNNCCNGESSVLVSAEESNPSGSVLNRLHVERFQKEKRVRVSSNPKRRNSLCGDLKPGAANNPLERGNRGGVRTEGRVCGSNDSSGNSGESGSGNGGGSGSGNSGGNGSGNSGRNGSGNSRDSDSDNRSGSNGGDSGSKDNGGSSGNDGNSEDNNEDHNKDNNYDSGNDSSNDSGNDNVKEKGTKGNNRGGNAHPDEPNEKSGVITHDNEHENYYKLIREIEFLENNENAKESNWMKKKDSIGIIQGGDEQKGKLGGVENSGIKLDSGVMEKEEDASMKLERTGEDNQLLNLNQMIIHTTNYVSQPLKLPLLPEMSHPNSYASLSPRNNTCGSSSSSSSSGSSGSSSGNSSTNSSGSCNSQGGSKNNMNQLNDPDFEEACDIRLMNTPENMKFSQSPPTSSLHASSLHLTDVNELVLSPNQQIYTNSPLKSPNSTPLTPASPIFDSNYNEENMEKVNSNYFVSSPYRNDIFSEFDMLGSFFESLDELENKSDYTESSSNENSKFSQDFSLDVCGTKKGEKKGNIQKDEVIYNFKRDNYKKVFHAWCNKGKHELNYDNKKFNSIMEWINYIEDLMSHEGQNDNKGDQEEQRQPLQEQQMEPDLGEQLEEEQCGLLQDMEHELEHEREQEDIIKIGMSPSFFNDENVYQVSNSAFHSDEYISVGKENEGGSGEVDYTVNSGVDYLVSRGVDYMVSSMADYAVSGGGDDCGNDQEEYYKDSGDNCTLKEENKCDNFLAKQNVNVMMNTPEQCNNSFVADNLNAYQANETGGGMSSQHSHSAQLSSSLIKPNYNANPCISTFRGELNLLSEYNNAEDNITYSNNDTRQEVGGDYFLPSTLDDAQIQSGSCGVGSSGFVWNNGASGAEGNGVGNITENVANAVDNPDGKQHAHVPQPVVAQNTFMGPDEAEKVGTQNEKHMADSGTASSNCADVQDPWMTQ
ncbi:hypothetical protein AK88_04452 [Plasmodium fragile]|uniref:Uncharacterized protein n=1 Tax=Plasmodium fragile TaxID=5857 RepID=A0A0D9QFT6_PLAFR|nr:uncharacterized protein AK88_04452 [Plasmodium fragile]KJP85920.1 hypothetical protein AK88_04452 [Plasmodium fragile]